MIKLGYDLPYTVPFHNALVWFIARIVEATYYILKKFRFLLKVYFKKVAEISSK